MSKLSKLDAAIQQLDKVEDALLDARNAFNGEFTWSVLEEKAMQVSEVQRYVKSLFLVAEKEAAEGLKNAHKKE
jgi:hypothetical protein